MTARRRPPREASARRRTTRGESRVLDATREAPADGQAAARAPFAGGLEGLVGPRTVLGWAADPLVPTARTRLRLRLRGEILGEIETGAHERPDLFAAIGAHHGFLLDLPPAYQPGDLAVGRLGVHPLRDDAEHPPIPARPRLLAQEQVLAGHGLLARAESMLGQHGLAEMLALLGRTGGFGAAGLATEANAALAEALRGTRPREATLGSLQVPVGTRSADGSVVVGRDGHLFLLAGSNGEVSQLGADPTQRGLLVDAWLARIAARKARAESLGIRFLQVIVPEKSSLAPKLLPDPAKGGPTPFLTGLEAALAARPDLAGVVVDGRAVLRAAARRAEVPLTALLRRVDSHPSPLGIHALARAVLEGFGETPPELAHRFQRLQLAEGDLGAKFLPLPVYEEIALVHARAFGRFGAEPRLVEEQLPPDGGHVGRRELWQAEGAPSARRLMAFGNSVCGTGRAGQGLLSGWLARCFAEYRFHWQPGVDWDAVEALRPDLLMCQTVERFMGRVPEA